jgi:Amt family ammonium transporter
VRWPFFMVLWSFLVYDPWLTWYGCKGGLLNAALGGHFPTLDFAGGTVVHVTSGVSALVCALYLGKRVGYPQEAMPPAQCGPQFCWCVHAVGGMVRV